MQPSLLRQTPAKASYKVHRCRRRCCWLLLLLKAALWLLQPLWRSASESPALCKCRSAELTALLSRDLDAVRAFVFANVSGNRGLRPVLEVSCPRGGPHGRVGCCVGAWKGAGRQWATNACWCKLLQLSHYYDVLTAGRPLCVWLPAGGGCGAGPVLDVLAAGARAGRWDARTLRVRRKQSPASSCGAAAPHAAPCCANAERKQHCLKLKLCRCDRGKCGSSPAVPAADAGGRGQARSGAGGGRPGGPGGLLKHQAGRGMGLGGL